MVEITKITPSSIELKNVSIADGDKVQKIMDTCHKFKHLYKEGFPCGRKTRRAGKKRMKKWDACPEICFTYLVTNDNQNHNLAIHVLVSDVENLLSRYSKHQIAFYMQMYLQDVADEILATI